MQKEIEITSDGNVSPFAIAVAQALTALLHCIKNT